MLAFRIKSGRDEGFAKIPIAVNLSMVQIQNPNIADIIEEILKESGLDSNFLELEITESIATKEIEHITENIECFKEIRCNYYH